MTHYLEITYNSILSIIAYDLTHLQLFPKLKYHRYCPLICVSATIDKTLFYESITLPLRIVGFDIAGVDDFSFFYVPQENHR